MVAVAVFVVSAIDVAVTVTVTAELEALGAVYLAAVVVVLESVPPPLTVQLTPALFLSFATVAVKFAVSVASTVVGVAETLTEGFALLPPQPIREKSAIDKIHNETSFFEYTDASTALRNSA
jgi:hypothetical protein